LQNILTSKIKNKVNFEIKSIEPLNKYCHLKGVKLNREQVLNTANICYNYLYQNIKKIENTKILHK